MRIIVCIKQIYHTYARTGKEPEEYYLSPLDRIARINPYDESALEIALDIKKSHADGEVILLTLGPIIAERELRRCLAMGADHIYQVDTEEDLDSWQKSALLARAIKEMDGSLVFCGKESMDTQNGLIGAFLAHRLEMPFVSAISELHVRNENIIEVTRSAGKGSREIIECTLPAVLSVDINARPPRLPTYGEMEKAHAVPIGRLSLADDPGLPKCLSAGIMQPSPRPKAVPAPDNNLDSFDRIGQLLMGSRIDKKGVILKGDTKSQVEGIIQFVKENGLLKLE